MKSAMQHGTDHDWPKQVRNSLNASQEQVTLTITHSLRSLYDDLLASEMLEHLQTLMKKLEQKHPP